MNFSPSEISAVTIAVTALIAAIFTGAVNIIVALRVNRKQDDAAVKVAEVSSKADIISGHVNSAAAAAAAKIEGLEKEIALLRSTMNEQKQAAALLAQAAATVTPVVVLPTVAPAVANKVIP